MNSIMISLEILLMIISSFLVIVTVLLYISLRKVFEKMKLYIHDDVDFKIDEIPHAIHGKSVFTTFFFLQTNSFSNRMKTESAISLVI